MIWDGNGYPVVRGRGCCAACVRGTKAFGETSCGKPLCRCHDDPAFGSERPDLGAQGDFQGSGALVDRCDPERALDAVFQNETTRRK